MKSIRQLRRSKEAWWLAKPDATKSFGMERLAMAALRERLDTWDVFFRDHLPALRSANGHCVWFNQHEEYKRIIITLEATPRRASAIVAGMAGVTSGEVVFRRRELYDSHAWVEMHLSDFCPLRGNEDPTVLIGIHRVEWQVGIGCFSLTHRVKHGIRVASLRFSHDELDRRFDGEAWAEEGEFDKSATRQEMFDALMAKAEARMAMVTVVRP